MKICSKPNHFPVKWLCTAGFRAKKKNCSRLESAPKKWEISKYFTFGVKMLKKFSQPLAFSSRQGWVNTSKLQNLSIFRSQFLLRTTRNIFYFNLTYPSYTALTRFSSRYYFTDTYYPIISRYIFIKIEYSRKHICQIIICNSLTNLMYVPAQQLRAILKANII